MLCPECNNNLQISNNRLESEVGSTDVYSVLTMICVNPKCGTWCGVREGGDVKDAVKIAATVRNKVS